MTVLVDCNTKALIGSSAQSHQRSIAKPAVRPCKAAVNSRSPSRYQVCVSAESLTSSVQLGPSDAQPSSSSQSNEAAVDAVELVSETTMQAEQDYTLLRDCLKAGEFEKADDETRALLIRLAGPDAITRNWVYFTEVKFIPEVDLQTMDNLWRAASNNKFGYTTQKELWLRNKQRWDKFFQQIDWVQGEYNNYRKWPKEFKYNLDAPSGHLPLTNALRGTQLFKAIMEHPAFNKPSSSGGNGSNGSNGSENNTPSWLV